MKFDGPDVGVLSTGKRYDFGCPIIGIGPSLMPTAGYDHGISGPWDDWRDEQDRLTEAECVELADAMIERWQEFKRKMEAA